jgi:hypothetical protein
MRFTLVAVVLSGTAALADHEFQLRAGHDPVPFPFVSSIMPRGAGAPPRVRQPQIRTELRGWSVSGEGYEVRADDFALGYQVAMLRSRPLGTGAAPGVLLHREGAAPWRGVRLVVRAELRTGMVDGAATIFVRTEDGKGQVLTTASSRPVSGTGTYRWEQVELLIPEGAEDVVLGVELQGHGAVYVRELHIDDAELLASR